jgi:hypothetical protein
LGTAFLVVVFRLKPSFFAADFHSLCFVLPLLADSLSCGFLPIALLRRASHAAAMVLDSYGRDGRSAAV